MLRLLRVLIFTAGLSLLLAGCETPGAGGAPKPIRPMRYSEP